MTTLDRLAELEDQARGAVAQYCATHPGPLTHDPRLLALAEDLRLAYIARRAAQRAAGPSPAPPPPAWLTILPAR